MGWRLEIRNDGPVTASPFSSIREVFVNEAGVEIEARRSRDSWAFVYSAGELKFKFWAAQNPRFVEYSTNAQPLALGPDCQVWVERGSLSREINESERQSSWEAIASFLDELSRIAEVTEVSLQISEDLKPLIGDRTEIYLARSFGDLIPIELIQLCKGPLGAHDRWVVGS